MEETKFCRSKALGNTPVGYCRQAKA